MLKQHFLIFSTCFFINILTSVKTSSIILVIRPMLQIGREHEIFKTSKAAHEVPFKIMESILPEKNFMKLNLIIFERMNFALAQLGYRKQLLSKTLKKLATQAVGRKSQWDMSSIESCR